MRKLSYFLVIITILLCVSGLAYASDEIRIRINGRAVYQPGLDPYMDSQQNRVFVPVRFVSEALGAIVDWEATSRTVVIRQGEGSVRLPIGATTAHINGQPFSLDAPACIRDGHTYVPLRFAAEALGAEVNWGQHTHNVYIKKEGLPEPTDERRTVMNTIYEKYKDRVIEWTGDALGTLGDGFILAETQYDAGEVIIQLKEDCNYLDMVADCLKIMYKEDWETILEVFTDYLDSGTTQPTYTGYHDNRYTIIDRWNDGVKITCCVDGFVYRAS